MSETGTVTREQTEEALATIASFVASSGDDAMVAVVIQRLESIAEGEGDPGPCAPMTWARAESLGFEVVEYEPGGPWGLYEDRMDISPNRGYKTREKAEAAGCAIATARSREWGEG